MAIVTKYFDDGLPTTGSLSMTYAVTANTITRGAGSFVTNGFANGDTILIQGTASNNGVFTILSVTALVITTNEALANETVTSIINKGDGTSWALRTNLFAGGAWSAAITGFAFNGTDSMVAYVGPGTTTVTVALASGLFANAPSAANPLMFHGCDGSGVILDVPDPGWWSNMPLFDDSTLPIIATTTNIATTSLANCSWRLIKFTSTARIASVIGGGANFDWIVITNSAANTASAGATGIVRISNSVVSCSGSSYQACLLLASMIEIYNCRLVGVTGSSGNRRGIEYSTGTSWQAGFCTIVGHGGEGVASTSVSTAQSFWLRRCTIANNGATGAKPNNTAAQTLTHFVVNCMITGNGTAGVDGQSAARMVVAGNRLRDNTTDIANLGNYPVDLGNYTTDSDDATEYVNTAAGDYQIKNTATIWGMGFGPSDEAPAGGGGASAYGFVG